MPKNSNLSLSSKKKKLRKKQKTKENKSSRKNIKKCNRNFLLVPNKLKKLLKKEKNWRH